MPDPPPNENTRSVESQKRPLSKDERIDQLEQALKTCVDSENGTSIDAIPVLLFLAEALRQNGEMVLRLDGMDIDYCTGGKAMAPILQWLASMLHASHNEIDAASLSLLVHAGEHRLRRQKPTNSRSGCLLGDVK
jgi:hypothetical protein